MATYRPVLWTYLIVFLFLWAAGASVFLGVSYFRDDNAEQIQILRDQVTRQENRIVRLTGTQSQTVTVLGDVVDNQKQMVKLLDTIQGG